MNKYFNPKGDDSLDQKIYGSNPIGFTNFNESRYGWAIPIYKGMENNSWFPSEVDTSSARKEYQKMNSTEQFRLKAGFAQLSFNDSIQEDYLLDIRKHTTNKIVKAVLTVQAMQEINHSNSYSTLLDASGNSEEVFSMYRTDQELLEKNTRISEQFARHIEGNTSDKLLLSAMASIVMEGIYFQLGFANIYLFGKEKASSAIDMVEFIARDELDTHLPIFTNIFKTIMRENNIGSDVIKQCYQIMEEAVEIELKYGQYLLSKGNILGLNFQVLDDTIKNYANQRLRAIGLERIYPVKDKTYLEKLVASHRKINDSKVNFFEGNVKAYVKGSIDIDDF